MSDTNNENNETAFEKWQKIYENLPEESKHMINVYQKVQDEEGYVSPEDAVALGALQEGTAPSDVEGFLSFFDAFRTRPPAEHTIAVCFGTACYAQGAPHLYSRLADELDLDEDGYSKDGTVAVEKVACVGACGLAPLIVRDGEVVGKLHPHNIPDEIEKAKKGGERR